MQQERNVVLRDIQVALVDVGDPGQRVEILDLRAVGIVHDLAVLAVADAENLFERLAVGEFDDGDSRTRGGRRSRWPCTRSGLVGIGGDGRPDEGRS